MKSRKRKDAFEIRLKKETRKLLIKHISPIAICFYLLMLYIFAVAGSKTGLGIIGWLESQMPLSILLLVLCTAMMPFLWFLERPFCRNRASENMIKDAGIKLVNRMMTPGKPINVKLIKSKGDFGDFVLGLQEDGEAELYAVLGEKDNLIIIYAVLKGEEKKRDLDVVTKGKFADYYRFVNDSENA